MRVLSDDGLSNIENRFRAKAINLFAERDPEIYEAFCCKSWPGTPRKPWQRGQHVHRPHLLVERVILFQNVYRTADTLTSRSLFDYLPQGESYLQTLPWKACASVEF
jgi:hypothetical protein